MDFESIFKITPDRLAVAMGQTIYMVSIALLIGAIIGIPLGIALVITRPGGIAEKKVFHIILSNIINIIRSVPFVILLMFILPFTRFIVGTTIGTTAAIVPLVCYSAPYIARLIEGSLLEVNDGILEAAESMGATVIQTIWHFLLPEALGTIILALTTGTIGLIGASAMAGAMGGGGVGNLALTYGYQRMNTPLMVITVIVLIIFVQLIQTLGDFLSKKIRTHS